MSGTAYLRDAETIVVSGTPVRLNGIDAPETSNRYGREIRAFVERLLRGQIVTCDLHGERSYDSRIDPHFRPHAPYLDHRPSGAACATIRISLPNRVQTDLVRR